MENLGNLYDNPQFKADSMQSNMSFWSDAEMSNIIFWNALCFSMLGIPSRKLITIGHTNMEKSACFILVAGFFLLLLLPLEGKLHFRGIIKPHYCGFYGIVILCQWDEFLACEIPCPRSRGIIVNNCVIYHPNMCSMGELGIWEKESWDSRLL